MGMTVFAETQACFDLDVWVQAAMILNNACRTNEGPSFVKVKMGRLSKTSKKVGTGSSTPLWNQKLSLGCHTSNEPLVFELYTNDNSGKACSTWTVGDWLAQSALNDFPVGGPEEDVLANTLVLPRIDGRVNLVVQLASYVHPEEKAPGLLDMGSLSYGEGIGAIVGGIVVVFIIVFASLWCCCFCCFPRVYAERRRRFLAAYASSHPASTASAAMTRPLSPAPPVASRPTSRTQQQPPRYDRPPPTAPSAYSNSNYNSNTIAVAMPVAEAVNTYRGGNVPLAEARVLGGGQGENNGRGGGGGRNGAKGANRKISV